MPKLEISKKQNFIEIAKEIFGAQIGGGLAPKKMSLLSHVFIKVNQSLALQESERQRKNLSKTPICWETIDLQKLAMDTIHCIELGLDPLIENHLHFVARWSTPMEKYVMATMIGYMGKDYYKRKFSLLPIKDIRYELIYEKDKFKVCKKDINNPVESCSFEIVNPFDRGTIIGGFGYIEYEDPALNKLILVSNEDFVRAEETATMKAIWERWPDRMKLKTIAHKTTKYIPIDPNKVSTSYAYIEDLDNEVEIPVIPQAEETLDISPPAGKEIPEKNPNSIPDVPPKTANLKPKQKALFKDELPF